MSTETSTTTQTGQQSSSQQGLSASTDPAASGGGSQTTTTPPARPDYVPESFWDPSTNQVKTQEFTTHIGELAALKAQHDARLAARPKDPAGYELKFSDEFKPEIAIKFDETDPRVAPLRALAHELNLDQPTFSRLLEVEAQRVITEQKAVQAAADAEIKKLGTNGTARVTAVKTFLAGIVGADGAAQLIDRAVLASDVELLEKLQLAFSGQGGSTYNNGGREPPAPPPQTPEARLYPQQARKAS